MVLLRHLQCFVHSNLPACFVFFFFLHIFSSPPHRNLYSSHHPFPWIIGSPHLATMSPLSVRLKMADPEPGSEDSSSKETPAKLDKGKAPVRDQGRLPSIRDLVGDQLILPKPSAAPALPELFIPGCTQLYLDDLPIVSYEIVGVWYNMAQPTNETRSSHSRWTVDRREIKYKLEVVQQPEKARACGSGPRCMCDQQLCVSVTDHLSLASADRRPVDPPPVVELRVYANDVDVTMSYDATFMLYASLEISRPIAHGKMHTPQAPPVLTGVAVASAAYLDRPKPAAYFIFPDLSVRHEGWYRLKFSLFEGVKHEADADLGKPFVHPPPTSSKYSAPVRHESMSNRMEVQSIPFQVFSAKKFPGLNMSTDLSKLVAEQGCRVRIRRDIRQRKRTAKAEPDADDARGSYQNTPVASYRPLDHSRSASRNSLDLKFEADTRRASVESLYRRTSIAGIPLGSPGLPNPSQMASAMPPPPPTFSQSSLPRPALEGSPLPSPFTPTPMSAPMSFPQSSPIRAESSRPKLATELENNGPTLAPLRNLPRPLYALSDRQPTKRSASSRSYDAEASLKDRQRPDSRPFAAMHNSIFWDPNLTVDETDQMIEPDTGEGEDSNDTSFRGAMIYERADGSKQNKWNRGIAL